MSNFENRPEHASLDTLFRILSAVNLALKLMTKDSLDETKFDVVLEKIDDVIEPVTKKLSANFPDIIALSIFDGMRNFKKKSNNHLITFKRSAHI